MSTSAKTSKGRNNIWRTSPSTTAFGRFAMAQNCPGLRDDPIVNIIRARTKLIKKSIIQSFIGLAKLQGSFFNRPCKSPIL